MSDVIKQLADELSSTLLQLEQVKRERDASLQLLADAMAATEGFGDGRLNG